AMRLRHSGIHKPQCIANAFTDFPFVFPSAQVGNAHSTEPEAGSGDTGDVPGIRSVRLATIFYQSSVRIGFVPEKLKASAFEFFEKLIFIAREAILRRIAGKQLRRR